MNNTEIKIEAKKLNDLINDNEKLSAENMELRDKLKSYRVKNVNNHIKQTAVYLAEEYINEIFKKLGFEKDSDFKNLISIDEDLIVFNEDKEYYYPPEIIKRKDLLFKYGAKITNNVRTAYLELGIKL